MATLDLPIITGPGSGNGQGSGPETEGQTGESHANGAPRNRPYVWQPPSTQRRVSLELDVVDRVLQEALRGLGSIPKRGAEIGGVLLGRLEEDGTLCITGSVPVSCSHAQGSSYMLSNEEYREFASAVARFAPAEGRPAEAVGFYRSHTREGCGLSMDDVRVFDALFPGDHPVILLVKPSVTRVSQGAFFFREEGGVKREASYLEFPFRRRELGGEQEAQWADGEGARNGANAAGTTGANAQQTAKANQPMQMGMELSRHGRDQQTSNGMDDFEETRQHGNAPAAVSSHEGQVSATGDGIDAWAEESPSVGRGKVLGRRWTLIPLSFLFLLLGVFLGIQVALTVGPRLGSAAGPTVDPYALGLRVAPKDGKVQLDWNLDAVVITAAQRGTLLIEDGGVTKTVPLTREQLTDGRIAYAALGNTVRFRLDVQLRDNAIFSESVVYNSR